MTAFTRALYYPWIDVAHEGWLKNALLYWDQLQTIVPCSIDRPPAAREFRDNGLLGPLFVESQMREIQELTGDVLTYINSAEGGDVLTYGNYARYRDIHPEKLPQEVQCILRMHPEKEESYHIRLDRRRSIYSY